MTDFIVGAIIVVIVGLAVAYIIRAKKRGARCVGCSSAGCSCTTSKKSASACNCGCGGADTEK